MHHVGTIKAVSFFILKKQKQGLIKKKISENACMILQKCSLGKMIVLLSQRHNVYNSIK